MKWVARQYDTVAQHTFSPPSLSDDLDANTVWVVTARISPAYDADPEIQFSLTKFGNEDVAAEVTRLPISLRQQMLNLPSVHYRAKPSEVAKLIKADRFTITSKQYPDLIRISAAFEELRPPIAFENVLVLDSRRYQLWLDAGPQQIYMNLVGASSGESRHPVIVWMEETRLHLEEAITQAREKLSSEP